MKPPPFDYVRASDTTHALELLADSGDDAKLLAGGQSLIPLLNFRMARPSLLIDIGRVGELSYIRRSEGSLRIGATTKHAQIERSSIIAGGWPLLSLGIRHVAHFQIRNAGTVGGSLAHADSAAELPTLCSALDARLHIRSAHAARTVTAEDYFVTHLTTALRPDEMLCEIEIPPLPQRSGVAFIEYARRPGDFALGGAAVVLELDDDDRCAGARLTLLACAPVPWRAREAERTLIGRRIDDALIDEAAALAVADLDPTGDIHGSSAYRVALAKTLVRRALHQALADATRR